MLTHVFPIFDISINIRNIFVCVLSHISISNQYIASKFLTHVFPIFIIGINIKSRNIFEFVLFHIYKPLTNQYIVDELLTHVMFGIVLIIFTQALFCTAAGYKHRQDKVTLCFLSLVVTVSRC